MTERTTIDEEAMAVPTAQQREAIETIRDAMLEARRAALIEAAEMAEAMVDAGEDDVFDLAAKLRAMAGE